MDEVEKKLVSPELVSFMNEVVKELVLITFKNLGKLTNDFKMVPDSYFIDNILKNYVGNMLLKGAQDSKHFTDMADNFLIEFNDFKKIASARLQDAGMFKKEVH